MTGLHVDSHPTVASGSCCTGRGATAAGSSAGARPRRSSFHGTPSSSPEKSGSRPRRASFHGTPPSSPEKGRKTRSRGGSGGDAKRPQRNQSSRPAEDVRAPRGAPLRPEDVMAQALQREGLAREPPSRDSLPSRSASWRTEPREAQGWGAPREHPRRSQSMHPGGGGDTQQLSMQRLQHVLAPAAPSYSSGAPPVRSQTWHPSAATRLEDLAAEKVRGGANRPATLYDPTCSPGAGNSSDASTRFDPPSCSDDNPMTLLVLYMYSNMHHICAGAAAAVQPRCTRSGAGARRRGAGRREHDADRGATTQDAEVAAHTHELS